MERRFSDLRNAKENQNTSHENLSHSKNSRINSGAHTTGPGLTCVQKELQEHNPSVSQTPFSSTPSSSPVPWDHTHQHRQSTEGHSQQPTDSIFSDQFFDGELSPYRLTQHKHVPNFILQMNLTLSLEVWTMD